MSTGPAVNNLAFERSGSGKPVVLLHGLGANRSVWRKAVPALSRTRDVIAVDLLGFGDSPRPEGPFALTTMSDAVIGLLDRLELDSVDLVGNSLGGWLAMFLAIEHPDRVRKLVAVGPAFLFGLPEALSAKALAAGAGPKDMESMRAYLKRVRRDGDTLSEDVVRGYLDDRLAARDEASIRAVARSIKEGENLLTGRLQNLQAPALVVHGRHDGVVPLALSDRVASEIEGSKLIVLEESAHWPQLEEPEVFVRVVEGFLS